jgi:hypothetical protein
MCSATVRAAVEPLEDAFSIGRRDTGARVGYEQRDFTVSRRGGHLDARSRRAVAKRVLDQVVCHVGQVGRIGEGRCGSAGLELEPLVLGGNGPFPALDRLARDHAQVHGLRPRVAGACAFERQQVVHQLAQAVELGLGLRRFVGRVTALAPESPPAAGAGR